MKDTRLQDTSVVLMSFNTNNYSKYLSDSLPASNNQYKTLEEFWHVKQHLIFAKFSVEPVTKYVYF